MTDVKIKKARDTKKCVMKRKIKFENYNNCLEASKLENKINHLEKNKINITSLKNIGSLKEFIWIIRLILQTQQRFKSRRHNVFTEELNKTVLNSNEDNRMQSIDPIETYAYGTSKNLVSEKEKFKCNYIIKQYKKWLTLMMLQTET